MTPLKWIWLFAGFVSGVLYHRCHLFFIYFREFIMPFLYNQILRRTGYGQNNLVGIVTEEVVFNLVLFNYNKIKLKRDISDVLRGAYEMDNAL